MKKLVFIVLVVVFLVSCSVNQKMQPQAIGVVSLNVESQNYEIVEKIEGETKVLRILIFPFGLKDEYTFLNTGIGYYNMDFIKAQAMNNALKNNSEVDYILAPKYDVKIKEFILFGTVEVKVSGKGVIIKEKIAF